MALDAGKLKFTLEYGQDLKDLDFFGKQDPYAIIKCGTQTARSKTHIDGGRHPVWAQTFEFNIINENTIEIEVYDEDNTSRDDLIGSASVSLAKAREQKHDKAAVPLVSKKGKQHGFIHFSLEFETNASLKAPAAPPAPAPYPYPYPYPYPAPGYAAPPGMPMATFPPPMYGMPPAAGYAPQPAYMAGAPPAGAGHPIFAQPPVQSAPAPPAPQAPQH